MFWLWKNKLKKDIPNGLVVMVVGNGDCVSYIQTSKFLSKLYTTSETEFENVINIRFNTFKELAKKCKALQVDLVIVENERWILEGIADVLKYNFVNCIAPISKWTELQLSNLYARDLLNKYSIDVPPVTKLPVDFPLIVKGDGFIKKANSVEEVIEIRENIFNHSPELAKNIYLEKYLDGKKFLITSLYDGKTLLTFPCEEIESKILSEYSAKLQAMLLSEKANFIGFINSEVVYYNNKLYNTGFRFGFQKPACNLDILYVFWLAIYQKLDEIELY